MFHLNIVEHDEHSPTSGKLVGHVSLDGVSSIELTKEEMLAIEAVVLKVKKRCKKG